MSEKYQVKLHSKKVKSSLQLAWCGLLIILRNIETEIFSSQEGLSNQLRMMLTRLCSSDPIKLHFYSKNRKYRGIHFSYFCSKKKTVDTC